MIKNILKFILFLIPWFLSTLICSDYSFFNEINIPFFSIPQSVFPVAWTILYILISISCVIVSNVTITKEYKKDLLINYLFNQSYTIIFFCFRSTFFGLISCILTLLTSLFLYYETKEISKKASYFLIPYTLFLVYASILSVVIYFINL